MALKDFWSSLKDLTRGADYDYEESDYDYDYAETSSSAASAYQAEPAHSNPFAQTEERNNPFTARRARETASSTGPAVRSNMTMRTQAQVVLLKPDNYEASAAQIVNYFRENRVVVFDLAGTTGATARRLLDFVAGASYCLEGKLKCVSGRTYLLIPKNVELTSDSLDDLTGGSLFVENID
ncbi:MAG: cell division protein SepF [Oscillospiraceae bacterium]|nr:cell division protein SepF [Oscillospiraceae bacterium]